MNNNTAIDVRTDLRKIVFTSLFAALIAIGSYIIIPLPFSPVPIALQSFFILFAGLLLGARWGSASVAIFLLVGAIGLPVFAEAKGGIVHFAGPTGGYLISYIPAALLTAFISHAKNRSRLRDILALTAGTVLIYVIGVTWLMLSLKLSPIKALSAGFFPFIPGDILKIAAAAALAPVLRPYVEPFKPAAESSDGIDDA